MTMTGRCWWLACVAVFVVALAASAPTAGDLGITWDEPVYRVCQISSAEWWERLAHARTRAELEAIVEPDALLYYWPYGRFGIDFHPPLAGQLNLLSYTILHPWMKDIPARRMSSVVEFCLTVTLLFGFLARRYGPWVGGVAAASLFAMPRLYGQAHLFDTDTPGLLLWSAAAVAFWKGLHEPNARRWRVGVGVLLGLSFLEKAAAVVVLVPVLIWLLATRMTPRSLARLRRADVIDGLVTLGLMLVPLIVSFLEIRRLADEFQRLPRIYHLIELWRARGEPIKPSPALTDLFKDHPTSRLSPLILLVPLAVWVARRVLGRLRRKSPVWGAERPALEMIAAILTFAPAIGWLGNPPWWRDSLPRLAHYYALCAARRGVLPEIQILYFGRIYYYSLPWHNAWALIAITVPVGILAASIIGLIFTFSSIRRDRLPLYFLVHLVTLPVVRMFETPGHDGVRLFLPTFFFLAANAGWGTIWLADGLARATRLRPVVPRAVLAALVVLPACWELIRIHPYELSYYNALVGGPEGAWRRHGCELTYWYDAFTPATIAAINERLPRGAAMNFANGESAPIDLLPTLQELGALRGDLRLMSADSDERNPVLGDYPYKWLLTNDAKASAFTRLLFAMRPWYESRPPQLGGLRVATVADPASIARARALQLLVDRAAPGPKHQPPRAPLPDWLRAAAPWLGRFWGEGVTQAAPLGVNEPLLAWARNDPAGLLAAARLVASGKPLDGDPDARRLRDELAYHEGRSSRNLRYSEFLLRVRPRALVEAVDILIARPEAVRTVLARYSYTDSATIGGFLDDPAPTAATARASAKAARAAPSQ
jgi:4-amino-4-deoxy-L-arabinose transferase-like glycosyltransferase